ncbi:MAG: OmpH family outer membrane protein [Hahellaceae bacterium]|jgi:outer membrane protein|nr:OmpH family outer membrane protein [Hahellaceae bacterium]MCP5211337.1 OmpH family outer membrane protein [Hahellaceae bacterium]
MRFLQVILLSTLMVFGGAAVAADKIAIVDVRTALFSSNGAREFSEKLKTEFADDEMKIKAIGEQAQKLQDRIKKDGAMMSESERSRIVTELEDKAKEFGYLKNKFETNVNNRKQEFLRDSKPKLDEALIKVAKDNKVSVLLPKEATLWVDGALDLTQKVVDVLNK